MDVEGGGWVSCDDGVRIFEGPFQPDVEEMSLDPAITMLRIFEEVQFIDFEGGSACLVVSVSS